MLLAVEHKIEHIARCQSRIATALFKCDLKITWKIWKTSLKDLLFRYMRLF